MIDRTGETCDRCGKGEYAESHLSDDMDGTLHCPICGDGVRRWVDDDEMQRWADDGGKYN